MTSPFNPQHRTKQSSLSRLGQIFKNLIELIMPDLRKNYRVKRRARVIQSYMTDGYNYYCDVRLLKNSGLVDESEPELTALEIPIIWAGEGKGIICPPEPGVICDVTYIDGDPNFPEISNFRYTNNHLPRSVKPGELIIQKGPGNYIKICNNGDRNEVNSGNLNVDVGIDHNLEVGGDSTHKTFGNKEEQINGKSVETINGNVEKTVKGTHVTKSGSYTHVSNADMNLSANGVHNTSGASVNVTSEGAMTQVALAALSQSSSSYSQTLTNASLPPQTDVFKLKILSGSYSLESLLGEYKIKLTAGGFNLMSLAGNMKMFLGAGLYSISNASGSLYDRLDSAIQFQIDQLNFMKNILIKIQALNVGTGVGPSSTPLNSADFMAIQQQVELKIQELVAEQAKISALLC